MPRRTTIADVMHKWFFITPEKLLRNAANHDQTQLMKVGAVRGTEPHTVLGPQRFSRLCALETWDQQADSASEDCA